MRTLAWLTDPHLDFAGIDRARALARAIARSDPDRLVITGDIAESAGLQGWLDLFVRLLGETPIDFDLGNHDFYGASVADVREEVRQLCASSPTLTWLGGCARPIPLTEEACLIGHDGWGDGRDGDVMQTPVQLADFEYIEDLRGLDRAGLAEALRRLGDEAAEFLEAQCARALAGFDHVIVATHVPPFRAAAWHEGRLSDDHWSPFFVCRAAGRVLRAAMSAHPTKRMTVLCGHTHSDGVAFVLPNLTVMTGAATYRHPAPAPPLLVR